MTEKKKLLVPFDTHGNQMHHPNDFGPFKEYKDNYEFFGTLTFSHFIRGCSAAYAVFFGSSGKKYTMFLNEFEEAIPELHEGCLTGTFTFVKHGQNFGVKLIKAD